MMTSQLAMTMLNHATGVATWTPPAQWYVAYFLDGTEITGGSYARPPIDFAAAVALSETLTRSGSSNTQDFVNLPTTDVDEARIVNTPSGTPTLTGWIIPYLRSFTAGEGNSHPVDGIAVGFTTS